MTIRTSARKPKNQTKCGKEEQRWGEYGGRTDKERRRKKGSSRTFRFNIGQFNNLSSNVCICINIYFLHLFPRFSFPVFDQDDNTQRYHFSFIELTCATCSVSHKPTITFTLEVADGVGTSSIRMTIPRIFRTFINICAVRNTFYLSLRDQRMSRCANM